MIHTGSSVSMIVVFGIHCITCQFQISKKKEQVVKKVRYESSLLKTKHIYDISCEYTCIHYLFGKSA